MPSRSLLVFPLLMLLSLFAKAQKTCGFDHYQQIQQQKYPSLESQQDFENWMSDQLQQYKTQSPEIARTTEVITIPVVVHVIHNGEPTGSGANLDEARILEQIDILNQDFRRMNADAINTPLQFVGVAADVEIEFALAVRDPEGLPTNGIVRVQGNRTRWDLVHNTELKAISYWPAEDYLNLWIAQLEDLLGFAQFPVSNLQGLEIASQNRLTDGVVIDTDFVGINPNSNPESLGRTATHEIGHYLGLRHIWGDGGCSSDDFCADTPNASDSHFGCPENSSSCGSEDMVQNYMDLTDDFCMNLFTLCQKDRIRMVMSNSPRRASLVNSPGLTPPVMVSNDTGIKEIVMPQDNICDTQVTPQVIIRNYGTNVVNSLQVQLSINSNPVETRTVNTVLNPLETLGVIFGGQNIPDQAVVEFTIMQTNGIADNNPENNSKSLTLVQKALTNLPIIESFAIFPPSWELRNDDNSFTWEIAAAVLEESGNTAIRMHFFDYDNGDGEYDYLITPGIDLSSFTEVSLEFKLAYAQFTSGSRDGLIVAVSTDCGNTYAPSNYIFNQQGFELATAPITGLDYVPESRNEWRTETLNLNAFSEMDQIKIAFIGINDFGNNLYLDDIRITGVLKPGVDLKLNSVLGPGLVSCSTSGNPQVIVQNNGLEPINSFQISYETSSGLTGSVMLNGISLDPEDTTLVTFPQIQLPLGEQLITFMIESVNGSTSDGTPQNNVLATPFIVDQTEELIPLIESFSTPLSASDWISINPDDEIGWEITPTSGLNGFQNQSAFLNFFNYSQAGATDHLVSPVLDFSNSSQPTLTFDLAYAGGTNFNDGLLILLSTDCGTTYADTVFRAFGESLATIAQSREFFPSLPAHWDKKIVDLSPYAGLSDIRVAFVGINDFGNNLFVDEIEFFVNDGITSLQLEEDQVIAFPNPAKNRFDISFNLSQRQDVEVRIIDSRGSLVYLKSLANILNQTLPVELAGRRGIYILQATGATINTTLRIILI